jgi:lipopolysaccharide transport system permease protein
MSDSRLARELVLDGEAQLRHPRLFVARAAADVRPCIELSRSLLGNSLRARYRQSVLGYFWLVITPIATAAVWIFLHHAGIVRFANTAVPYPLYVISGVFLWTGFLKVLNAPLQQLNSSRHLLSKIAFPWEAVIIAGWGEALIEFLLYLAVLIVIYPVFGVSPAGVIVAVPAIVALLLLGGALGLMASPIGMLYDDVSRAIGIATFLLFFLTPVVYPVPTTMPGALTLLLNPVGVLLVTSRELMTSSGVSHPGLALGAGVGSLFLFGLAWLMFRLSTPHLVSRL